MVWHAACWTILKKYSVSTNRIRVIKNLYDKATSAVVFTSSIGDWFLTTVGVRFSLTVFNIFLERIMTGASENNNNGKKKKKNPKNKQRRTISIGRRTITISDLLMTSMT